MGKKDIIEKIMEFEPQRYMKVEQEQSRLKQMFSQKRTRTFECPYCRHTLCELFSGEHSGMQIKCQKCGTVFILPPVVFSRITPKTD